MQWRGARFFYTYGYRTADALNKYFARRVSDALGVQRTGTKKTYANDSVNNFSPGRRAKKVAESLKDQVMVLAGNQISEYKLLMNSDVEVFLLKFDSFIKSNQNGNGISNV